MTDDGRKRRISTRVVEEMEMADGDIYEDGKVVSHGGQWLAGKHKAEPGLIMPESAPAGAFEDCIKVRETSPLEPGSESIKFYCPGIGLIADGDLVLQAIYDPERDRPAATAWPR